MQRECESTFREFPEIFQCTYENVSKRSPEILKDARAKLYLLRGEQLAMEVIQQKITSLDAKVSWQKLYVELQTAKDQEMAAAISSISRSIEANQIQQSLSRIERTRSTVVTPIVNCTSNKLGSSVYTTCQ